MIFARLMESMALGGYRMSSRVLRRGGLLRRISSLIGRTMGRDPILLRFPRAEFLLLLSARVVIWRASRQPESETCFCRGDLRPKNSMVFPVGRTTLHQLLALMNSPAFEKLARLVSPKGFGVGPWRSCQFLPRRCVQRALWKWPRAVEFTTLLFNRSEVSRGFEGLRSILLGQEPQASLQLSIESALKAEADILAELNALEHEDGASFAACRRRPSRPIPSLEGHCPRLQGPSR